MRFRVVEIENQPTAIFHSKDQRRNSLLSQFLLPSTKFVATLPYDISKVERGIAVTNSFEHQVGNSKLFKERIIIEPDDTAGEMKAPPIEIRMESMKLILFQWGAAVQRWEMKRKMKRKKPGL
jgi:hypothetical protein